MGYFTSSPPPTGGLPSQPRFQFIPPEVGPTSDKPYGLPEAVQRPDLNQAFFQGSNVVAAAAHAPGYVAERPLAWANTLTANQQGKGFVDEALDTIRSIPVLGPALGMVGDALTTPWAAKIINAQTADYLGKTYGMPDDTPLPGVQQMLGLGGIPFIGLPFQVADYLNGADIKTVGDLRQRALQQGFTQQDIEDLHAGRKGNFDFGDVAVHENPLFNLGAQLALDPTNLAFGLGAVAKVPTGVGLLSKFFKAAGVEAPKAFEAWTAGRNLANEWHTLSYTGLAQKAAALGRGTSIASRAYLGTSIGLTGAELGLTALGDGTKNTPISGLTEPLADFARRAQKNEPLSKGVLFSLISAFKFPYHDTLQASRERLAALRYSKTGSGVLPAVVRELAPNEPTFRAQLKKAAEDFGGEQHVNQFAEWAIRDIAAEKVQRYFNLKGATPDTAVGLEAFAAWGDKEITRIAQEMMEKGTIKPAQVVERMKDIATNARQVGELSSGVRFPWMPEMVGKVFTDWRIRVSELAQAFNNRAPVVLKILKDLPLPKEHIQILRGTLDSLAELNGGVVPRQRIAELLHDYPQLLRDEPFKTAFAQYLLPEGPQSAPIAELQKLLRGYEKKALPLSDYLYEFRDWEQRWNATMPKARSFDPVTRRWSQDASVPVGEVRVIGPAFHGPRPRHASLKAQNMDDVAALRGDPLTQSFRDSAPKALDQSGFGVDAVTDSVGFNTARGELQPHVQVSVTPSANAWADAGKIGLALAENGVKAVKGQADYFIREMSARMARAIGLEPNALRYRWQFGRLTPEQGNALAQLARRTGGQFDDHRSVFEFWERESEFADDLAGEIAQAIAHAVPEDPAIGRLLPQTEAVYVQRVANDARKVSGADEVFSNVRAEAATDPRYFAAATYLADARKEVGNVARPRGSSLRRTWEANRAGVGGKGNRADAERRVADAWAEVERIAGGRSQTLADLRSTLDDAGAIKPGMEAQSQGLNLQAERLNGEYRTAVDGFLAALHENVAPSAIPDALSDLRAAVEARVGDNPIPPALDDALLRAHEDYVATGGNMGQVLFNAKLDAGADAILPVFDKSLADAPLELKQQLAETQRRLVIEKPTYTLALPPKHEVPLIWSNEVGKVFADYNKPRPRWIQSFMDRGPISAMANFQRMLFAPRGAFAAADATKQELYNQFLKRGATVNEVNGYIDALKRVSDLFEIRGVKVFRSYDSLPLSVYEKIALGEKGSVTKGPFRMEYDPKLAGFKGFGDKVIESIGPGNFWKLIDTASSSWYRNVRNAIVAGGKRGQVGRGLMALYPKAMGLRHYGKVWYHVFRFLTDPRWWLMNEAEAQVMLGTKYGVSVRGASKDTPSTLAKMHLAGGVSAPEAQLALDAAASGWYDSRRLLGPITRVFDADAPRSVQRMLDNLPESDPIIKMMLEKHREVPRESWGKMLIDDIEALDARGAEATVIGEAKKIWSAQEYDAMEKSGVLQRVWELNEQRMADINHTLRGNPNRNLMERMLNSYWLYWPISYQLKAGKWLYDVLTHRMFGKTTNLGGAYLLSNMMGVHERLLRDDPSYAAMFEDNPETWFFAQMFLPITPLDLSVSLSRAGKVAGGLAGLWETPNYSDNPFLFAAKLASMGPTFTIEMLERLGGELDPLDTVLRPFNKEPAQLGT